MTPFTSYEIGNSVLAQLLILWRLPVDRVHLERCAAERSRVVLHTSLSCFSYRRDTVEAQSTDKGCIGQIWDFSTLWGNVSWYCYTLCIADGAHRTIKARLQRRLQDGSSSWCVILHSRHENTQVLLWSAPRDARVSAI